MEVYQVRDRKTGERNKDYRWRCRGCSKFFSVRTGLVLEETRLPLRVWAHAFWRACSSKKGVSALQISRECQISYKSALFLMHRIRESMREVDPTPLTGVVEVDETYIGGKQRRPHGVADSTRALLPGDRKNRKRWGGYGHDKAKVIALVERGGRVRARHIQWVTSKTVGATLAREMHPDSTLMTDEAVYYKRAGKTFPRHESVNHSKGEYARGDAHTNTVEGFFSLLKRGIYGTFHVVSRHHLHRYLSEFEFRYNTRRLDDGERLAAAIRQGEGRRLSYYGPAAA